MQRFANDRSIERKAKLGKSLTLAGFGVLIGSLVLSFTQPQLANLLLISAFTGTLIIQIGFLLTNRWGKHPRTDELIDQALKGFGSKYAIFHYLLGADHVLFAPTGVYALIPSTDEGQIEFRDGKWIQTRMRRGKPKQKRLKYLSTNSELEARALAKALRKRSSSEEIPEITPLLVFLNPEASIRARDSVPDAVHYKKLKSYLRKMPKLDAVAPAKVVKIAESLGIAAG